MERDCRRRRKRSSEQRSGEKGWKGRGDEGTAFLGLVKLTSASSTTESAGFWRDPSDSRVTSCECVCVCVCV